MEASKEKKRLQKELNDKVIQDRKAKNENRYRIFLKEIEIFQAKCEHQKLDALLDNELSFPINLLPETEWLAVMRNKELGVLDINKLLNCGADKVSLNTAAIKNSQVVIDSSKKFLRNINS
jgi:hypothetical protein